VTIQLSVIVATHNRRDKLRRCLEALSHQTVEPALAEVIVADDGSTDGTAEMVDSFSGPLGVRLLRLPKRGKSAALNAGIEAARGKACLFLDDDIVASPELLEEHLTAHREGGPTLAMGTLRQEPPAEGDPYARAFAEIWNERYRERLDREADWADCYGGNFSAPRDVLTAVGGFAVDLPAVEDLELAFRLCREGCSACFLPRAAAVHDDQKPGRRILADEERFGVWCADFVQGHPEARHRLLGWFNTLTIHEITLRRLLLALRVPAPALARLGRLLPAARRPAWFGFVSRHAFWRGVRSGTSRSGWLQTTRGVPILMYHAFSSDEEDDRFVMPKRSFAWQMRILSLLRYRVVRCEDLAIALAEGSDLPRRAVAITVDDGYLDNFGIVDRVLRRYGFPATIFLVSDRLGASNDWDDEGAVAGRALLSSEEIERMRNGSGIRFGAHTRTHASLPDLDEGRIESEISGSREDLESALGAEVPSFAYPYGRYDDRTVDTVAESGFRGACTACPRRVRIGDDPMMMPRIEIFGQDSLPRFLRKLWFGGG